MAEGEQSLDPRSSKWLKNLSDSDALLLRTMPEDRRSATLRRLSALLALDEGAVGVVEAGEAAGMARSAFHKLRKRWERSPSLVSVAPYATRSARGSEISRASIREVASGEDGAHPPLLGLVREILLNDGSMSNGQVARFVRDADPDAPEQQTLVKLVRRMRQELSLLPEALQKSYGRRLLVDLCALGIIVAGTEPAEVPLAGFVVDQASGLVLAAKVARREGMWTALEGAIRKARTVLREDGLDVVRETDGVATVVVPDISVEAAKGFRSRVAPIAYIASGERRFGQRLVSVVGRRIGRIELKSAYTLPHTGVPGKIEGPFTVPMSMEDIEALVEAEIGHWNEPILARIRSSGLDTVSPGRDRGSIDATLTLIEAQLSSV
ncbi:hypothetical protein AAG602_15260 [Citromicrobium bathyomarinum]